MCILLKKIVNRSFCITVIILSDDCEKKYVWIMYMVEILFDYLTFVCLKNDKRPKGWWRHKNSCIYEIIIIFDDIPLSSQQQQILFCVCSHMWVQKSQLIPNMRTHRSQWQKKKSHKLWFYEHFADLQEQQHQQ